MLRELKAIRTREVHITTKFVITNESHVRLWHDARSTTLFLLLGLFNTIGSHICRILGYVQPPQKKNQKPVVFIYIIIIIIIIYYIIYYTTHLKRGQKL